MPRKSNDTTSPTEDELRTEDQGSDTAMAEHGDLHDEANADEKHDDSPADKVVAAVEPKTDLKDAIKTLVEHVALEFEAAEPAVADLAKNFTEKAEALADAALKNVEQKFADGEKERGYDGDEGARARASGVVEAKPHNHDAVESAVAHGMDRDEAKAMTEVGSNL